LDYSLADVVNITGGKRRSVQLWADAGAIHALPRTDRRGTGTHRRFSRDEVIIACCVNSLARRQVGIGELARIGKALRKLLGRDRTGDAILTITKRYECHLLIIWEEAGDPDAFLLEEQDFASEITRTVKGRGLSIILPLREALAGLRQFTSISRIRRTLLVP
jgi:hypothetical protein